jgi:hypothetical protein
MLRSLAEAATVGAREGRARLALELLAVETPATAPAPLQASAPIPAAALRDKEPQAARPVPVPASPPAVSAEPASAEPANEPANQSPPTEVDGVRSRWGEVVERAAPAIKPLLRECRPIAVDGARLTLAFPEERSFMRAKAATRAPAIEQLLSLVLGGSWAIECVASNVELEPLTVAQAIVSNPADADGLALLEGVLRITGGELVDAPEVRS